ncbi:MAG: hypothetical protein A3F35_02790 [Candidatus Woykebacteria bacterium RIFCSPHIGHO2_12_FULL_45_10]|uniref:Pilus assembly protein PilO n=1 Tax=Candidatus Woykebacteria bacterium RIFCSPHIGHO2_12_FULL_45_10 TaxID=1802603 RepID=A0A1G1WPP3_9BACT|nr:MAG: hypothetical protein A3F35_02790 [Candidatus Woykebacteria bacterium RIFCSPHIGHO2_12_FULL_45_10]
MNLKNLNRENLLGFVVPVLCFVVIVGLVPLIIMPQLDRIAAASKVVREKETRLNRLKTKLDLLNKIDEEALNEKVANAEITLPSGKSLAPLVEGIKKLSSDSNLILNSMKLKPGKIATDSAKKATGQAAEKANPPGSEAANSDANLPNSRFDLLFAVELKGNFESFQKFLSLVEKTKRLLIVVSFTATSTNNDSSFSLIMNAPYRNVHKDSSDTVAEDLAPETDETKEIYNRLNEDFIEYTKPVPGESCQSCTGTTNPFP